MPFLQKENISASIKRLNFFNLFYRKMYHRIHNANGMSPVVFVVLFSKIHTNSFASCCCNCELWMLSSRCLWAKVLVQKGHLSLWCLAVLMNVNLCACLCSCENSGSVLSCDSLRLKRRHKSSCTGMLTEEIKSKYLNASVCMWTTIKKHETHFFFTFSSLINIQLLRCKSPAW